MKKTFYIVMCFLTLNHAFNLASRRKLGEASSLLGRRWFSALSTCPNLVISLEYRLLRLYLSMENNETMEARGIFVQIWHSPRISYEEKSFLSRYVLGLLWIGRGRQGECLLRIRHGIQVNLGLVRHDFRLKFSSPDENEDVLSQRQEN